MVSEEQFEGEASFACDVCGLHYRERETAERCEAYCREHDACSTEIIKESLEQS
ncbi:MAG: hypothetical protein SVU32_09510 [Candidatus Nanohaloarchaea archaeon]|nr:hypothetical protein [Candidatus Nanohaloarchaea archaeon]